MLETITFDIEPTLLSIHIVALCITKTDNAE